MVLAANNTSPQMTPTTIWLPAHAGNATSRPLPRVTVCGTCCGFFPLPSALLPLCIRRNTSSGISDNAPSENRVALKNRGDMESMPWTCETNASPQINAVNIRQPMPAISFFCISHHRKRNRRERKRPDRNTVRPNYCTITRYLPNNLPAHGLFRGSTRKACSEETA